MDSEARYEKNGGHPLYGKTDITYRFNACGFRCEELADESDLRVLTIGCSLAFGEAVREEERFSRLVCDKLAARFSCRVADMNLADGGSSNGYLARMLYLSLPVLNPDLVLLSFTSSSRREYFEPGGRVVPLHPKVTNPNDDLVLEEIIDHYNGLASPYDDLVDAFRNYCGVAAALEDREWVCAFTDPAFKLFMEYLDQSHTVGSFTAIVDRGRDHGHPGPLTHRNQAEAFWKKLEQEGAIERLGQTLATRLGR